MGYYNNLGVEATMAKETWSKPELIVVLRNHPEETLQQTRCKHPGIAGPGNTSVPPACADNTGTPPQQCFSSGGTGS